VAVDAPVRKYFSGKRKKKFLSYKKEM